MKVLITGGAGFIGSHLAERLLNAGDEVVLIDDLSTGSEGNIAHLRDNPKLRFFRDDVANDGLMDHLVRDCDVVYHLAAAVGVQLIVSKRVHTIETNVHGTEVVLKLAAKHDKRVLLASTSEVYGKSADLPFREDGDLLMGPSSKSRWSYACSKAIDEFLGLAYWNERKVPVVIARLFNTVGPRQTGQYGMVVPRFVKQALAGDPITVFGDGGQSRCFCNVNDVVGALPKLIGEPRCYGQIFNLGSQEEVTIGELAELVRRLTDSSSEIEKIPYDQAYEEGFEDMRRRVPSTEKAKEYIGFTPTISLEETVLQVVAHMKAT